MRKRRSWRFSQGGGSMFLLFLFLPLIFRFFQLMWNAYPDHWLSSAGYLGLLAFMSVLLWFTSLRLLLASHLWRQSRSWYESCFGIAVVFLFYAAFIFVTGYTPTKYASHPVPREAGFFWLGCTIIPLVVGSIAYFWEKRRVA